MKKDKFIKKAISSNFLQKRISLNENALNNFDHWSVNVMPKIPIKSNILDLGCGTGKQINLFSSFLTNKCNYYGCDISKESINLIKDNYTSNPKLNLINDSFDNLNSFTSEDIKFDLIYSFYSLYYTEDIKILIEEIYKQLKEGGIFWVVIPYKNTNIELFDILEKIYKIDEKVKYSINGFSQDVVSMSSDVGFKEIDISLFENKIFFNNKNEFLSYIENTTFYNKKYKEGVKSEIKKHFKNNFSLTKEVISIKLTK